MDLWYEGIDRDIYKTWTKIKREKLEEVNTSNHTLSVIASMYHNSHIDPKKAATKDPQSFLPFNLSKQLQDIPIATAKLFVRLSKEKKISSNHLRLVMECGLDQTIKNLATQKEDGY